MDVCVVGARKAAMHKVEAGERRGLAGGFVP